MPGLREILEPAIMNAPVVEHDGYYDIYPNFGSLMIEPELVQAVCKKLVAVGNFDCHKIALVESMAIAVGTALALDVNLPYTVIRKRQYKLPGEVSVSEHSGYSRADFYINGIEKGTRVVVFDDTINTGETLVAIVRTLQKIGAEVVDILTIMDKGNSRERIGEELGITIKTLVAVSIKKDSVDVEFIEEW
jgi:adenine phosphoribosyltransferase